MCGIVGAIAGRQVRDILLEGLRRLEYRGYDSAGVAIMTREGHLERRRAVGKVAALEAVLADQPINGNLGIAHTRWATHGRPLEHNAHPHMSGDKLAVVHNGIIENYESLKQELEADGYRFESETDTEVVAHLIAREFDRCQDLFKAVDTAVAVLKGAYALGVVHTDQPDCLIGARKGSPLVIGVGVEEMFIGSDPLALLQVTDRFIYLQEGDVVKITRDGAEIHHAGQPVERPIAKFEHGDGVVSRGGYRHFMLKEIYDQAEVIGSTLEGRLGDGHVLTQAFGADAEALFDQVEAIQIVACGTSYHAGMVARYWIERLAGIPTQVEIASEYRYREVVVPRNTLFVTLSQSGETADTLAALRFAQEQNKYIGTLAICNVPGSSLVRESQLCLMTQAGPEIGVASTKAFTTQLVGLLLLAFALRYQRHGKDAEQEEGVRVLRGLPEVLKQTLALDSDIEKLSSAFAEKQHALFLGRGPQYPIALEGALKLKEISYIHAEAYPAGELKHGPLALVDSEMPVIAVAPNDELIEKLKSNLQEVRARGGELFVFADAKANIKAEPGIHVMTLPTVSELVAPIVYTLPLQLLAYHVAVLKGTDVDQPRNLAKSVTVE